MESKRRDTLPLLPPGTHKGRRWRQAPEKGSHKLRACHPLIASLALGRPPRGRRGKLPLERAVAANGGCLARREKRLSGTSLAFATRL
jgi:hypothetical protein